MSKLKQVVLFFRDNNELWSIPLAGLLWLVTPDAIRLVDPTAGSFDAGYLHKLPLALIFALSVFSISWLGIYFNFGRVNKYLNKRFANDFEKLTEWQKIKFSFALLCGFALFITLLVIGL